MKISDEMRNAVKRSGLLPAGGAVVLGLSGGADSCCLLDILAGLQDAADFQLLAVHLNHGIRGTAAEEDVQHCRVICAAIDVRFSLLDADVPGYAKSAGLTVEEAGRLARYEAFSQEARELSARSGVPAARVKIAVAHNLNDRAETVLMRLIRGTGPDGLASIDARRADTGGFEIIRPLLSFSREEIEAYCQEKNLTYCTDETNEEDTYLRNRIRMELLPLLKERYNENIVEGLARYAGAAARDRAYFEDIVTQVIADKVHIERDPEGLAVRARMPLPQFEALDAAIKPRLIRVLFAALGLTQDIAAVHVEGALKIAAAGTGGKVAQFPRGYEVRIRQGQIEFLRG